MLMTLALLASSLPAFAGDNDLHPQVAASAQGTHVVNKAWEVRGSGHFFWAPGPEEDVTLFFLYAGPRFRIAPWLSIAPQIGSVVGWNSHDGVLPLISVWNWIDFSHLHFFVEGDVYPDFTGGKASYYGLYIVDYDRLGIVSIGGQVEQVDASVNVGPHIGAPLGDHVWVQVDYHRGLGDGSNNLRLNLNVSL